MAYNIGLYTFDIRKTSLDIRILFYGIQYYLQYTNIIYDIYNVNFLKLKIKYLLKVLEELIMWMIMYTTVHYHLI